MCDGNYCSLTYPSLHKPPPYVCTLLFSISFPLCSFPEGTDLNDASVASSERYSEKMGVEKTHYTMHPRVRGFSQAAVSLSDRTNTGKGIDAVYNVTMAYEDFSKVYDTANSESA